MAKRKKRAATFVSKKASAGETPHHRKTDDCETSRYFKTANDQRSAEQVRNVGRLPSADRLLLNADHPRNAA